MQLSAGPLIILRLFLPVFLLKKKKKKSLNFSGTPVTDSEQLAGVGVRVVAAAVFLRFPEKGSWRKVSRDCLCFHGSLVSLPQACLSGCSASWSLSFNHGQHPTARTFVICGLVLIIHLAVYYLW